MIKCNVNVIGKVYRPVELKEDRNGNPFVTFGVSVELKDKQESKSIDISVASDGEDNSVLSLKSGDRVKITGSYSDDICPLGNITLSVFVLSNCNDSSVCF